MLASVLVLPRRRAKKERLLEKHHAKENTCGLRIYDTLECREGVSSCSMQGKGGVRRRNRGGELMERGKKKTREDEGREQDEHEEAYRREKE